MKTIIPLMTMILGIAGTKKLFLVFLIIRGLDLPYYKQILPFRPEIFFFSKKLYQKVGPFGDLKLAHDLDFLVRCLPWTEPIFFDDELYFYRFHGSNTTYQVKHLLHQEMQAIYFKYLSLVTWEAPLNPLAPCKWYWPYEFTFLRQKLNMDQMLIKTILKGKQNAPTSFTTWDKQATTFRKTLAFAADLTKFYFCTPQTIQLEGVKQWPIWLILACLPFKKVHWHIPEECHPNAIIPGGFARKLFQKFCHNNALTFSFNSERTFQQWQRQGIKGYVLEKPPLSSPQEIQIEFKKNQWNKIHAELNKFISAKNQNQLPLETRLKIKNFPYQDCEASVGDFILKVMNSGYKDQIDL